MHRLYRVKVLVETEYQPCYNSYIERSTREISGATPGGSNHTYIVFNTTMILYHRITPSPSELC